jgi:hypothetical protein
MGVCQNYDLSLLILRIVRMEAILVFDFLSKNVMAISSRATTTCNTITALKNSCSS